MGREARKVQITGKSTRFVSLPKRWVDAARIRSGDFIYLVPQADGRLVIEPVGSRPVRNGSALRLWLAESSPEWVMHQIATAYAAGWSVIHLPMGLPARLDSAQLRNAFLGLDVTDGPEGFPVIHISCETNRVEPIAGLRRLRSIVRWRLASALHAAAPEGEVGTEVPTRQDSRRLGWYMLRQTTELQYDAVQARSLGLKPGEPSCLQRAVRALLKIEDILARDGLQPPEHSPADLGDRMLTILSLSLRNFLSKPEPPEPAPWRLIETLRRQLVSGGSAARWLEDTLDACAEILAATDERYYCNVTAEPPTVPA